jgi:hypothetical protein
MKWFEEVFLPSLESKMNNPKYPNSCILSEKQAEICYKYMKAKSCRGDYGGFTNYEITIGGKYYQMTQRGKYHYLNMVQR